MTGKSAVIICDGDFPRKEYPRYLISRADVVICCDGTVRDWPRRSMAIFGRERLPDAVVGDMDTLSPALREQYKDLIVKIEEQEDNDQTKAVRHLLSNYPDVTEIHIIGATGKREDHTIGNISLLMEYTRMFDLNGKTMDMVSDYSTMFAITDSCELAVGEGRRISIISPDNSLTITSEGLEWQTSGVVFNNWWKATLNRAVSDVVRLTFSHPSIALVILP